MKKSTGSVWKCKARHGHKDHKKYGIAHPTVLMISISAYVNFRVCYYVQPAQRSVA